MDAQRLDPVAATVRLAAPGTIAMLCPVGVLWGDGAEAALAEGRALPFQQGPARQLPSAFSQTKLLMRTGGMVAATLLPAAFLASFLDGVAREAGDSMRAALVRQMEGITRAPAPFAGIVAADRPAVMGIVNVTPDSFSDGGECARPAQAIARGLALRTEGAAIIDVGGESTRPGATPVGLQEELDRVLPVVEGLAAAGVPVSVDTRHAEVMRAAIRLGALVFNDITGLARDIGNAALVEAERIPAIAMHMRGEPGTMQHDPRYMCAPLDVADGLARSLDSVPVMAAAGQVAVDPGIGFGKSLRHNLEIMAHLPMLHGLGAPVMLGASRKSFIAQLSAAAAVGKQRLPGSLAAAVAAAAAGVQMVRVHDVADTVQALEVDAAIRAAG